MPLQQRGQIDQIESVLRQDGSQDQPANATEQEKTNVRLGNFGSGYDNTLAPANTNVNTLSAGAVPEGVEVVVQADPGNAAPVKVGLTNSPAVRVPAGQSYTCRVDDRSQIHYQLEDSTDSIHVSHEVSA